MRSSAVTVMNQALMLTNPPKPIGAVELAGSDIDDGTLELVGACLSIDTLAAEVYRKVAASCRSENLRNFWLQMAAEEAELVRLWEQIGELARAGKLPPIFEDARFVAGELRSVRDKVLAIFTQWESDGALSDPFVIACRLELSMLQPAFGSLFHFCRTFLNIDFYRAYDDHLNCFLAMLADHGTAKPELELLGEMLRNLWLENKSLSQQVNHDHLTGLLNRRGFRLLSRQMAYYAQRNGSHVGVLMLDLDDFRAINERFGHPAGDRVLQSVATTLRTRLRKSDIVGRYGGEEFVIFCPEVGREALVHLAESIRRSIESAPVHGIHVTASIGAISGPMVTSTPERELDAMIDQADHCLYRAKHAGKNAVAHINPS